MLLEKTIDRIEGLDEHAAELARERQNQLTKPQGSLGRLEEISIRLAGISGRLDVPLSRKRVIVMAGDHGVAAEGVSAFPQEVTQQMVLNFLHGGAAINVLARHVGAEVSVVDMGVAADLPDHPKLFKKKVAYGTKNIAHGPAMTRDEAVRSVEAGIEVFEALFENPGIDLVITGDMGIANTTPSSAIIAAITGRPVPKVTGRGTGVDENTLAHKIEVIEKALELNSPDPSDPLDVLAKVGGFEIGGIAGVILAAASHRVPVLVDGIISTAGALLAGEMAPESVNYMFSAHASVEKGQRAALEKLGLQPILDLNMRLGEGTGGALAAFVLEASVKILNEMATFAQAGVSEG